MEFTDGTVPRRDVLRAAVALGGASALAACLGEADRERDPVPTGNPDAKPARQHAWNDALPTDEHGNTRLPEHQVLLYVSLDGGGPPAAEDRRTAAEALATLDRAYEWSSEGLVHSIAYSRSYFDRFDAALPDSVELPQPRALSSFENPTFDTQDAVVHLASDRADVVLEAERALTGDRQTANGERRGAVCGVPSSLHTVAYRQKG